MPIIRQYILNSSIGKETELTEALLALAESVQRISGNIGVEILRDYEDKSRFIFLEKWESIDAHVSSSGKLSPGVFANVMSALVAKPEAAYLGIVKVL